MLILSTSLFAEVTITRPNMILTDENGKIIEGLTESTTEVSAMEKASNLPDGTYLLKRPDAVIVVKNNFPITSDHMAFKGSFFVDPTNNKRVKYTWKMISGLPHILMPEVGEMYIDLSFPLPAGINFNVLAVEQSQ